METDPKRKFGSDGAGIIEIGCMQTYFETPHWGHTRIEKIVKINSFVEQLSSTTDND